MNTPKWIVVFALVLALAMPATPVSAARSASMSLTSPVPNQVSIGNEVSFALVFSVTDIDPGVTAAEIFLAYDDTLVEPPVSPKGGVESLPDFFGTSNNFSVNEILKPCQFPDGTSNPSSCIHLIVAGPPQITHSGAVARFHFRAKASGKACFSVLQPNDKSKMVDANANDVPVALPVSDQCVTIGSPTITGVVKRPATPTSPNPGGGTLACSTVWYTSGGNKYGPVFTDDKGNFKLTNLPSGAGTLHAEYSGHLASEKAITLTADLDVGTTTLPSGDVNDDGKINISDIGAIIGKLGKTGVDVRSDLSSPPVFPADCADPDEPADINDDGNINIKDIALVPGNMGRVEPTPWQP